MKGKYSVLISKNFIKGALGAAMLKFWVWPSCNYAHIFKDVNILIQFNTDVVQSTIRNVSITM